MIGILISKYESVNFARVIQPPPPVRKRRRHDWLLPQKGLKRVRECKSTQGIQVSIDCSLILLDIFISAGREHHLSKCYRMQFSL